MLLSIVPQESYVNFYNCIIVLISSLTCADDSAGSKATDEAWSSEEVCFMHIYPLENSLLYAYMYIHV